MLKPLGSGGEGSVFLALNENAYKFWAIKIVAKGRDGVELELWKHFSHPNLPEVIDVIETESEILIVMDYVEGRNVANILKETGKVKPRQAVIWGIQICRVLHYLHSQEPPVVYGDLKPDNMICRADKSLVLVDFGTVSPFVKESSYHGGHYGTKGYAAPEQYDGTCVVDTRADIYSLGVTLFQLVTGKLLLSGIGKEDWKLCPGYFGLKKIICKCMRFDRTQRFSGIESCERALQGILWWRKARYLFVAAAFIIIFSAGSQLQLEQGELTKEQSYEEYLKEAKFNVYEEQKKNCQSAIFLNPVREEAYQQLIEIFLEDAILTEEEDIFLRKVLKEKSEGDTRSHEEALRTDEGAFLRVSYELGMAYWYYFEGDGGKSYAARWFLNIAEAAESIGNTEITGITQNQRKRAAVLAKIGSYYSRIRNRREDETENISYLTFWKDLMEIYDIQESDKDADKVNLLLWEEISAQSYYFADRFCQAGLEKAVLDRILREIKDKVQINDNRPVSKEIEVLEKDILKNIELAIESVERIYNNFKKEGKKE
ncbi:serine/threonine protein kinase [Robinsoniella sp. KNHs210]|uniref:serine/threonine protein kinase n=1 Tax=Robinsoniella sp. KNHs210 TaxID=1469950 RepID=UPI002101B1D4|nr:serine/threonine-protein kinase [Robinsoniella sp. KNHs210]